MFSNITIKKTWFLAFKDFLFNLPLFFMVHHLLLLIFKTEY